MSMTPPDGVTTLGAAGSWVCQPELAPACSFDLAPPVTG
jgi:hypothetical protein